MDNGSVSRKKILSVAVSEEIEAKIRQVADAEGLSMSSWIRSTIIRVLRARGVVGQSASRDAPEDGSS